MSVFSRGLTSRRVKGFLLLREWGFVMKLKFIALWLCLATAPAAAQDLPASVTDAYGAYLQAVEAGDAEAALGHARAAYRAAGEAGVDPLTRGVLGENYAVMAAGRGEQEEAARVFMEAGGLYREAGEPPLRALKLERLGVEAYYRAGEADTAMSRADTVADMLETLPETTERDFELARTRGVQAHVAWSAGRHQTAGQRAREAFTALQRSGEEMNADTAFLAYYAGIEHAFRRDERDAAYWFEIASQLFTRHDVGENAPRIAEAWGHYARGKLDDFDRRVLLEQLAENGWIAEPCREDCENAEADADGEAEIVEDENNRDARPVRRPPPDYPSRMAMAGVQGITLVMFDVDARGRTQDIEVLFSAPHNDFGEEAERAVSRWRYEPKLVDGEPVLREDVVTEFNFALEN